MKTSKCLLLIIVVFSLAVTFYCQRQGITDKFMVHDDVNQYIPAVYALLDTPLNQAFLQGDLLIKYMVVKDSPGHLFVYYLFGMFFDPLILTKILPFLLAVISAVLLFNIGKILKSEQLGFFAALMFSLYVWTSKFGFFSGGFPKSFAFPLLLAFVYYLLLRRHFSFLLVLMLQILFYPIIAVISLVIYFFSTLKSFSENKRALGVFIFISVPCLTFSFFIYKQPNDFLGDVVTYNEMITMPEFFPGGRQAFFFTDLRGFLASERSSGIMVSNAFPFMFLAFIISCIYLGKGITRLPRIVFYIIGAGALTFLISYLFLFHLFFPGRYIEFTLPIFLILVTSFSIDRFLQKASTGRKYILSWIVFTAITISIYSPFLQANLYDYKKDIYQYINQFPEDSFLAGHPYDMDSVPVFGKRRVLVQFETATSWYKNYYSKVKERTYDFFKAYYSDSFKDIAWLFDKYKLTHLVVNKRHFEDSYLAEKNFYVQPFNDYVVKINSGRKKRFILTSSVIKRYKVYDGPDYFIIKLKPRKR